MAELKQFLSGNEAIAHGAFRAGCTVAAAYPGTPSSEILPALAQFADHGVYCEWSVNEKVAMEVVIGASLAGARVMTAMKHVGLNVAADPLMTLSYLGVNGGLVVVSADDPGLHSSQNEQDNRHYARFAKIPMLEPSDSQEAYEMARAAFALSEEFDTPVLLRTTTRTSHSSSVVDLEPGEPERVGRTYTKDIAKTLPVPMYARRMRLRVEERMAKLLEYAETCPLNRIEAGDGEIGIVTSGVTYQYVKEVFPEASVLKLGLTYPLPRRLIAEFAKSVRRLFVLEELDPFLEEQIRAMGVQVEDHATQLHIWELNPERLRQLRAEITGQPAPAVVSTGVTEGLPARPPVLCPGCGHRGVFYVLNKLKATVTGDIGCYALGAAKPLDAMDTIVCMGASIGNAFGFEKAQVGAAPENRKRVAAVLGDSTFFHSGITGLLNIVYNRGASTVIVLDNRTTAMTGHQDHPGTGRTLRGEETPAISIEQVARGVGVERVRTVDCYDLKTVEAALKEELAAPEPSVVVAKRPCIVGARVNTRRQFRVTEACKACRACLRLGCPALELGDPDPEKPKLRRVRISTVLCAGCGLCAQVCPHGAIEAVPTEGR